VQRGGPQPVKCKGRAVHIRTLLKVDVPSKRLDVHHGRVARHLLWEWGLNGLAADTELLTSELVTNAVKATVGQQQAAIRLRLSSDSARVMVEVWDADPQPPIPRALAENGQDEGGRGLFLVAALSSRCDWYRTREPPGKVVWCELAADLTEPTAGAQSAPQALGSRTGLASGRLAVCQNSQ
jgi:anti-sigma regulatory factor (Ser/Thr protein kinase)